MEGCQLAATIPRLRRYRVMPENGWIVVDWGTTNRRAYALNARGEVEQQVADACGILAVQGEGFPAEVARIRAQLGDRPMILAGMIGSNRGWIEVPYVPCPATLDDLIAGARRIDERTIILPGVSQRDEVRPDVMRGEEVQLLGAVAAGLVARDAASCHPGTHAKWTAISDARIDRFQTVMTGELFGLLRKDSILAPQLAGEVTPGAAFRRGVRRALTEHDLPAALFSVRAGVLLATLAQEDAAAYASGLLIGSDVGIGLRFVGAGGVALIGEPALIALYAAALDEAGRDCCEIDGETALLAGCKAIAERML
jgi:2-dehydro-3-deoxygalactonokinase